MNICTMSDFSEYELVTGTCKYESCCVFEGTCPMQELADEYYASLKADEYYASLEAEESL